MKIGIIGRTEILYKTALLLKESNYDIAHIVTSREAPEYTKTSEDFHLLAEEWGVPFVHTPRISEQIEFIQESPADIGVSINYSGIIPQSVIDCFPLGILNAHGGDLPRYRGNACQAWAILNGEDSIGLCIHRMIGSELDSGDIIGRDYLPIDHTTKITAIYEWFSDRVPQMFLRAVQTLQQDPKFILERQSIDTKDALRCYPRRPEDGQIDWSKGALDVLRLINASNKPYAGAFCEFEGEKMIIWDSELVDDQENYCAVPGQVTHIGSDNIEVACGEGKLKLFTVEVGGDIETPTKLIKSIRQRLL